MKLKLPKITRTDFNIFLFSYLVFLFFIRPLQIYGGLFTLHDLSISIIDHFSLVLTNPETYLYSEVSFINNHFYSGCAPGIIIFLTPLYLILKPFLGSMPAIFKLFYLNYFSTIFISIPAASLSLVLLNRILSFYPITIKQKLRTVLLFGFGTYFFAYAPGEIRVTVSLLFLSLSIYILILNKHNPKHILRNFIFIGLLSGFMGTIRYEFIFWGVYLFFYFLCVYRKQLIYFICGISIPIFLLAGYHTIAFGSPFKTSYSNRIDYYEHNNPVVSELRKLPVSKEDLARYLIILSKSNKSSYGEKYYILDRILYLKFDKFFLEFFSPSYGLYIYFPGALLSILFLFRYRNNFKSFYPIEINPMTLLGFIFFFHLLTLIIAAYNSSALFGFGPRYQILTLPCYILIYPILYKTISTRLEKILWWFSMIFAYIGVLAQQIPQHSGNIPRLWVPLVYAIKEFIAKTGIPAILIKNIPSLTKINTFYMSILREDISITNIIHILGLKTVIFQLVFQLGIGLIYVIIVYLIVSKFIKYYLKYESL